MFGGFKRMISLMFVMVLTVAMVSCNKADDTAKDKLHYEQLRMEKEKLQRDLIAAKEEEIAAAKQRSLEQAERAKFLQEELIKQEDEAKQKIFDEKERLRLLSIAKRQQEQKVAFDSYINTKYDVLELLDGKLLKSVKVTAVSPINVTFMHQNGVARVEYSNLPEDIREVCMYDVELEHIELARQIKLDESRRAEKLAKKAEMDTSAQQRLSGNYSSSAGVVKEIPAVKVKPKVFAKGGITVRLIRSKYYHRSYISRTYEVIAKSNVDAYLSGSSGYRPVKAGVPYRTTFTTSSSFEVRLVAKDSRKVLDRETHSRKSGLSTSGGL